MKVLYCMVISAILLLFLSLTSPKIYSKSEGKVLPTVIISDLEGNTVNTAKVDNDGSPILFIFWSATCKFCKLKLNAIHEVYPDWQDETGVKLIAVSIDTERAIDLVRTYVNAVAWDFEVWMDANSDFKRAIGVNKVPHAFLTDHNGEIVFSQSGYVLGDEVALYDEILKVSE